ncbi:DUF5017 domain-containing protein [Pedobacter sp. ASV1-7]|uniref:DUF5017 domain-containing protein n=1 Tax=Pedobacter sp. ASV1-7 TaxID=3145237 RepID=UPI0032E8F6DB
MENLNLIKKNVMLRKMLYMLVSISLLMEACTKAKVFPKDEDPNETENTVNIPFDVKLKVNKTYKVGERVEFILEGNPESIDYYSGIYGYEYEFRNGKKMPSGMELDFFIRFNLAAASWPIANPDWGPIPWDKISLLVSTDFDGDYTFGGVKRATWQNVTNRVTFPPILASTQPAGPINLSDLTVIGKPFYFAFRMIDNHPKRPFYLIQSPIWYSVLGNRKELIGHLKAGNPGENTINLVQIDEDVNEKAEVVYTAGPQYNDRFTIRRKSGTTSLGKELWLVSKGFHGVQETLGGFSSSIPIKSPGNTALRNWGQVYLKSGIYQVGFVSTTLDSNGERHQESKVIEVTIED